LPRRPEERPVGWSPDFVLGWLKEHPTQQLSELVEQVAPRCGEKGVLPAALYAEFTRWRRDDRAFSLELRRLTLERKPAPSGPHHKSRDFKDPDWRQKWAVAYLKTRSYAKAAEAAGLDKTSLWRKRTVGHPEFEQEFYDVWRGCLEAIKEHYEDVLHWALEESELQGDARTAGNLALTILERVDKARWTRAEDRSVTLNATHNVNVQVELSEGAHKALRNAELLSAKIAGALGSGAQDVIDVTPTRVREKVAVGHDAARR